LADASALIPVIVGPTAAGKTAVAGALAALTDIELISADSRQVYRGLDVGTAKPAAAQRAAAPYHGLDLIAPTERYSAGRFARDAARWIGEIRARGRLPVVVGGSGLYLRALFEGLLEEPELDGSRRERLRSVLTRMEPGDRGRWARRLDAGFQGGGSQREMRALEVALLAGTPLSGLQRSAPAHPSVARPWYARLALPRDVLRQRIDARTRAMLAGGLVEEVQRALHCGVPRDAPGLSGLGYSEAVAHLDGRMTLRELELAVAASTRRYAKRQETWFRHQLPESVTVLDGARESATLARELLAGYRAALKGN
jgi:tRNA dimethylallyltransferase